LTTSVDTATLNIAENGKLSNVTASSLYLRRVNGDSNYDVIGRLDTTVHRPQLPLHSGNTSKQQIYFVIGY